jgi:hypothetical protein
VKHRLRILAIAIGDQSGDEMCNQNTVTDYNDAEGRAFEDVLGIIRKAKALTQECATGYALDQDTVTKRHK